MLNGTVLVFERIEYCESSMRIVAEESSGLIRYGYGHDLASQLMRQSWNTLTVENFCRQRDTVIE